MTFLLYYYNNIIIIIVIIIHVLVDVDGWCWIHSVEFFFCLEKINYIRQVDVKQYTKMVKMKRAKEIDRELSHTYINKRQQFSKSLTGTSAVGQRMTRKAPVKVKYFRNLQFVSKFVFLTWSDGLRDARLKTAGK